jgi:CHAT domain-containing protein
MHLPGVRPELNEVSTALNEREAGSLVSTYEDSACTSAALLHELAKPPTGPSLVHIATHATFNATRPGLCVLSLADGGLSVPTLRRALGGAPIDLDLFVLSACGTARQDHDVEGFAVTLLSRGVRGVIATLWESLDLSAPRLFGAFYRELRGAPAIAGAARALQFAQREMLTSTDLVDGLPLSHPAHWATYVLVTSRYPSDPVT